MLNWLTKIGVWAVIVANWKLLARLLVIIIAFFLFDGLFKQWLDPTLGFNENIRILILSFSTLIKLGLVVFFVFSLRHILWIEKSKIAIKVDESFKNPPENFKKIENVELMPNLREKDSK